MSGMPEALTHKIGPLPAGAWALAVAGGIGVALYMRHSNTLGMGAPTTTDTAGTYQDAPPAHNTSTRGGAGNLYQPGVYGSGPLPPVVLGSNNAWRIAATKALTDAGRSASGADLALRRYLGRKALTDRQTQAVAEAIRLTGPPPQPVGLPKHNGKGHPAPGGGPHPQPPAHPGDPHGPPDHNPSGGKPRTNRDWLDAAARRLAGHGYHAPGVRIALETWLAGRPLSPHQVEIRDRALSAVGQPPNPPRHKPDHNPGHGGGHDGHGGPHGHPNPGPHDNPHGHGHHGHDQHGGRRDDGRQARNLPGWQEAMSNGR